MRIVTNKKIEGFTLRSSYRDFTGESDDGMRRGHSYTVHVIHAFYFENERNEDGGWGYDLRVVKDTDDYVRNYDMTETAERFEENFDFIATALRNKGIFMLNFPAYMSVKAEFHTFVSRWAIDQGSVSTAPDENAIELSFNGRLCPAKNATNIITTSDLVARVSETDGERKSMMIARAIGDQTLLSTTYHVALESIPDELYGKTKLIRLKKVALADPLKAGVIDEADVEAALTGFASRVESLSSYYPLSAEGIEKYIISLPDGLRESVLKRSCSTRKNLQLFRAYCPERINWRELEPEDYAESDLDLMIQGKVYAYTPSQWEFIERCMAQPELERKVVENAYVLGWCSLSRIANNLHTCTPEDLFRSVLEYGKENPGRVDLKDISCLFGLEYEGLGRDDYDGCLALANGTKSTEMVAFVLKVGLLAGVGEMELVEMLLEKKASMYIELYGRLFKGIYERFHFAPGLAWVKDEEDRQEAMRQRAAKERAESNEKVVQLVQTSGKLAVRASLEHSFTTDGHKVCRPDGECIGILQPDEQRVMLIEGRRYCYLVNVERVKKLHSGVFHFDVLEADAGYIIGSKGSHVKEITQKLNELGCEVRNIKIHTHMADEV
jgi:hypothetical protein